MTHSEAVAKRIDARIAELKREIAAHERALAALKAVDGGASAPGSAGARRPRTRSAATNGAGRNTAAAKPRGRRRAASSEAVFEALKSGEDQASQIANQFGVSVAVVRNRLTQLEEAGRVSRTGNRRSTRWRSNAR
jgi:hypothetical protein